MRERLWSDILRIAGQVSVRIGQTRQDGSVREIDHAITRTSD